MGAPDGVEVLAPVAPEHAHILTPEALAFVAGLEREFRDRRAAILAARAERAARLAAGERPDFLAETAERPRSATGASRRRRPTWTTGASRSPARPSPR